MVLWNTRYLDAAVARLRAEGYDIKAEGVVRLSPFKDRHVNFLGRYLFHIKAGGSGQDLCRFRDPDASEATRIDGRHTRPTRLLVAPRGGLPPDLS